MADLSDVEDALVGVLMGLVYPLGSTAASALQVPVNVFRGLPASRNLALDRKSGTIDISVFPVPGTTKDTTRWGVQSVILPSLPGLTASGQGNSTTFSGIVQIGDLAGVLVMNTAYVYTAQNNDSPALVAAILADAIRANMICSLTGATISVPGVQRIVGRTAAPVTALEEWGRQEQQFRISIWVGNPILRDKACSLITSGFAPIAFVPLADGTGGRLRYHSTASIDDDQASSIYRRDLFYTVEYGTTVACQGPTVLFPELNLNSATILV